jgi:hypothetical protein
MEHCLPLKVKFWRTLYVGAKPSQTRGPHGLFSFLLVFYLPLVIIDRNAIWSREVVRFLLPTGSIYLLARFCEVEKKTEQRWVLFHVFSSLVSFE